MASKESDPGQAENLLGDYPNCWVVELLLGGSNLLQWPVWFLSSLKDWKMQKSILKTSYPAHEC